MSRLSYTHHIEMCFPINVWRSCFIARAMSKVSESSITSHIWTDIVTLFDPCDNQYRGCALLQSSAGNISTRVMMICHSGYNNTYLRTIEASLFTFLVLHIIEPGHVKLLDASWFQWFGSKNSFHFCLEYFFCYLYHKWYRTCNIRSGLRYIGQFF